MAVLHTSSVQVGNPCAQLFANSICSFLTASCLSFLSDPKKIQNISLFHQTFVYDWTSMAIASSHQIPHHNRWCLPLWHSPRLTISLSLSHLGFSVFSFSQAQPWPSFCFHSHLSPLAVPLIGVTATGGRGSSSLILYFFIFYFFLFSIFCLPFRQDWNPFDTHFVSFFISLMNNILFQFWLTWWMGFLVWISGISNKCYYWHL